MRASPVLDYAGNPGSMELDMDRFKEGCLMHVWTVAALTVAAVAGLGYMHPLSLATWLGPFRRFVLAHPVGR
jgi:hypothetical protein